MPIIKEAVYFTKLVAFCLADFERVLDSFVGLEDGFEFKDFAALVKEKKLMLIYHIAVLNLNNSEDQRHHARKVTEVFLQVSKLLWIPGQTCTEQQKYNWLNYPKSVLKRRLGAFYLLYLLYEKQPLHPKVQISITADDILSIDVFRKNLANCNIKIELLKELMDQFIFIFTHLKVENAFELSFLDFDHGLDRGFQRNLNALINSRQLQLLEEEKTLQVFYQNQLKIDSTFMGTMAELFVTTFRDQASAKTQEFMAIVNKMWARRDLYTTNNVFCDMRASHIINLETKRALKSKSVLENSKINRRMRTVTFKNLIRSEDVDEKALAFDKSRINARKMPSALDIFLNFDPTQATTIPTVFDEDAKDTKSITTLALRDPKIEALSATSSLFNTPVASPKTVINIDPSLLSGKVRVKKEKEEEPKPCSSSSLLRQQPIPSMKMPSYIQPFDFASFSLSNIGIIIEDNKPTSVTPEKFNFGSTTSDDNNIKREVYSEESEEESEAGEDEDLIIDEDILFDNADFQEFLHPSQINIKREKESESETEKDKSMSIGSASESDTENKKTGNKDKTVESDSDYSFDIDSDGEIEEENKEIGSESDSGSDFDKVDVPLVDLS